MQFYSYYCTVWPNTDWRRRVFQRVQIQGSLSVPEPYYEYSIVFSSDWRYSRRKVVVVVVEEEEKQDIWTSVMLARTWPLLWFGTAFFIQRKSLSLVSRLLISYHPTHVTITRLMQLPTYPPYACCLDKGQLHGKSSGRRLLLLEYYLPTSHSYLRPALHAFCRSATDIKQMIRTSPTLPTHNRR